MLPKSIESELFNINHQVGDIVLDYICNHIEQYNYDIVQCLNLDLTISIKFRHGPDNGELRIDRISRQFEICVHIDGFTMMPVIGDWDLVIRYLAAAIKSIN